MTRCGTQWPTVPLGGLAEFRNGINYTKENFGKGIRVLNVKDFQDRAFPSYSDLDEIDPTGVVRKDSLLKENDIVFVRSNGNRELIGRSLMIRRLQGELTHSAFTIRVRFVQGKALPRFFAYVFRTRLIRDVLTAHGGGTNISNLNQDILSALPVPLPPREDQERIAAALTLYDNLIENNTRRIEILEEMARQLHLECYVNRKAETGWGERTVGDLAAEARRSVNPASLDGSTPYVGLEHMPRRSIALADWGTAAQIQSTKFAFRCGEILFGKIRPYFHKVVVAPFDGICSSDAIVIQAKDPKDFALVLTTVSSDHFVKHATQTSNGTKMPRANWRVLLKYPIAYPPAYLRERLSGFIEPAVDQMRNLIFRNRTLRATRDLLLPRLVSGEIHVAGESLGPASESNAQGARA